MTWEDWRKFAFDEVVEIVHNRLYYVRGTDKNKVARSFRLSVGQTIAGGHTLKWVSTLDERVDTGGHSVWVGNFDLHPSYSDDDAESCLNDAVRALAALLGL